MQRASDVGQTSQLNVGSSTNGRAGSPPTDVKRFLDLLAASGGNVAAIEIRQSVVRWHAVLYIRGGFRLSGCAIGFRV